MITGPAARAALEGLRILEISPNLAVAHAGQIFSDFGAEVVMLEPPGGAPIRRSRAFPFLARGKQSVVVDLGTDAGRGEAARMAAGCDALIEAFRPGVADRLGLGYDDLAEANPSLVYASVSGYGRAGRYAGEKGYDALVMARIGGLSTMSAMVDRPGPAFASVPFCSFSAAQLAAQAILAALLERERSGAGQKVETSLLQGIAAHDIWNWFLRVLTTRYPDAYTPAAPVEEGVPNSALVFRLLVALSADGRWMQYSQTSQHLFTALMRVLGLDWMFGDPAWKGLPVPEDRSRRVQLWDLMIERVRDQDLASWQGVFDAEADVWAEPFREGDEVLDHPQLLHDGNVVVVDVPGYGRVVQPGPIAGLSATPADVRRPPPQLGAHRADVASRPRTAPQPPSSGPHHSAPLEGVTVVELGFFYAAPFAATLLGELGARVIKVEPLDGDPLRSLAAFPEVGAIKALQGKESVAVDISQPEGLAVVHDLVRRADIVLQSFRAGAAERLGVDSATLCGLNPALVYVNAPGYGSDGPCGHRPAYAPTIAAAAGIACRLTGPTLPRRPRDLDLQGIKEAATRLIAATNSSFAQSDGLAALGNASSILVALLARARGLGGQTVSTSMLQIATHANCEAVVRHEGEPDGCDVDDRLLGFHPLYRLYETADGWIMLACPAERDRARLKAALAEHLDSPEAADALHAMAAGRQPEEMAGVLEAVFRTGPAAFWEAHLARFDIGCAAVADGPVEAVMLEHMAPECDLVTSAEHPMLDSHPRLRPLVAMSRSRLVAGNGCSLGQHTEAVLGELGHGPDAIERLKKNRVIA